MDLIFSEVRNTKKQYAAFFDLDRTLIREISGNALVRAAWRKDLMSWSDLAAASFLYLLYILNIRDPLKIIVDMVGWVKGMPEAMMMELSSEVVRKTLKPSVLTDALAEINIHKENNAKVVILSSSLNPICREVSESLGMDGYICSSLEARDGYLTGQPLGRLCFGEEKLNRLTEYCNANNLNQSDSWYYGDSISDLPVLSSVGNPVCVNPERKLKKEAQKRGWKVSFWHH
jgi:HAD superfamily hydrolase (TIGR01490 family)